jgi:[ribosomal protein S18]-alanine N-acetyltransferase
MNASSEQLDLPIEFRQFSRTWQPALASFFRALEENGDTQHFHPHPFSEDFLEKLSRYQGKDLYYVAVERNNVLAYGLLRGWDEGYAVPSLGIALLPNVRGTGLGKAFMHFLHVAARRKGALRIRLKVYPDNTRAVELYRGFGYVFQGIENEQMVGILTFK